MSGLNILLYRVTQEKWKKEYFFNGTRNGLKCACLHALMVRTVGGLDFFWTVYMIFGIPVILLLGYQLINSKLLYLLDFVRAIQLKSRNWVSI